MHKGHQAKWKSQKLYFKSLKNFSLSINCLLIYAWSCSCSLCANCLEWTYLNCLNDHFISCISYGGVNSKESLSEMLEKLAGEIFCHICFIINSHSVCWQIFLLINSSLSHYIGILGISNKWFEERQVKLVWTLSLCVSICLRQVSRFLYAIVEGEYLLRGSYCLFFTNFSWQLLSILNPKIIRIFESLCYFLTRELRHWN